MMARHKFDLHIHTCYSACSSLRPEKLLSRALKAGLTAVAVTDHNTFEGAVATREVKRNQNETFFGIDVILGIECRTEYGEFGIVFLEEKDFPALGRCRTPEGIFSFARLKDEVSGLRAAGRPLLVCLNHPFAVPAFKIPSLNLGTRGGTDLERLLDDGLFNSREEMAGFFDFTEINAGNRSLRESEKARELASQYNLPLVCNSDSHFAYQVGRCYTIGHADTVRDSIIERRLDRHEPTSYKAGYYRSMIGSGTLKAVRSLYKRIS